LLLIIPAVILPFVYMYDVVNVAVKIEIASLTIFRELFIIVSFVLIGLFIENRYKSLTRNTTKEIGRLFFGIVISLLVIGTAIIFQPSEFSGRDAMNIYRSAVFMIFSTSIALVLAVLSLYILLTLRDLIYFKRRKSTRRYYITYLVLLFAACIAELPFFHLEDAFVSPILYSFAILSIIVNSFKQNWIVYLSKREKMYSIVYSILMFIALVMLDVFLASGLGSNNAIISYSRPLHSFIWLNAIFGTIYFGVTFISTLFHLPTAEVFEKKQSELNSLHNLSRLATQVFDFDELVNTVTQMTSEVCDARSVWLELFSIDNETGEMSIDVVSKKNITQQEIDLISADNGTQLKHYLIDSQKALLIEDIWSDRRTKYLKEKGFARGSLLTIPLLSYGKLIGVLHATKEYQNAFDQEDIDVMTTFAENVSIAIENSRLITKSIERERLHQEMMVAQRMQKRLLPQKLPEIASVEFAAVSESSFEVGGDYYDVISLPDERLGIVIGDVSGKGVSAAFYMAEVKGIVLSLSKICSTPKELLLRANDTLLESLEKNAFISAVYAVLDVADRSLTMARAGHCPVILISGDSSELIKSSGIGLGLTDADRFEKATEERKIKLKQGDICIFYTDGITEARNADLEEFGYERLVEIARECRNCSADVMKNKILHSVRTFAGQGAYNDDITLIVVKWLGNSKE
jgi:phosphoserine phosphatase RsbU/P